jgi:hypothetical protein
MPTPLVLFAALRHFLITVTIVLSISVALSLSASGLAAPLHLRIYCYENPPTLGTLSIKELSK